MLVGILASVMSTIAAFLNSISTLFTMDVYKKWINKNADERTLVRVGTIATFVLMLFSVFYSPLVGIIGGGIFNYFQMVASYIAVPIATVFLVGILWKRATSIASLTVMIAGIPIGISVAWLVPHVFAENAIERFSLDNFFITSAMGHVICVIIMVVVSLFTEPRPVESIAPLLFSKDKLFLPKDEPQRPFLQSVGLWWAIFVLMYVILYIKYW